MSIEVAGYYNIRDKEQGLHRLYKKYLKDIVFIVPAGLDREALLDEICSGEPFFGDKPQVMTAGDLLAELSRRGLSAPGVIDPPDHNLILRWLLEGFLKAMEEEKTALAPGVYHRGFVSVLGDNIKDLLAEEISPEELSRSIFGEEEPEASRPEAILIRLYQSYIDYLAEHKLADAAQIPLLVRQAMNSEAALKWIKNTVFVFSGFLSFTGSQLKLVSALSELTTVLMLQPETGLDNFHDGIYQLKQEYKKRPGWSVKTAELEASNKHLELEALARETALWADGQGSFSQLGTLTDYGDIGIMISPDRLSILRYALERYQIPYNLRVRGTVGETPAGRLAVEIWTAFSCGWDYFHTLPLISNPLLFTAKDGSLPQLPAGSFPTGFESWQKALRGRGELVLNEMDLFCRKLAAGGTPVEILTAWSNFLNSRAVQTAQKTAWAAGAEASLDEEVKNIAFALFELDKKIKVLTDEARDLGEAAEICLKGAEAAGYITDWGSTATLPIQLPQSRSLTVYAGMPPILTSHRFWIMTGVDLAAWPGTIRESLLLGNSQKSVFNEAQLKKEEGAAHLPELREEREQKEAVFRRLAATAREGLIITRSLTDNSKDPVGESPFVTSMLSQKDKSRGWELIGKCQYPTDDAMPDGGAPWFPQAEVISSEAVITEPDKMPEGRAEAEAAPVLRVSDLDTWAQCPYKYWCLRKMNLETPQETLYSPMTAGSLVHKIWEEALNEELCQKGRSIWGYVTENWQRFKNEKYPELDGDTRLLRYEKKLLKNVMEMALRLDTIEEKARAAGRSSISTELSLPEYEIEGCRFHAKADRIDYYSDGVVLLDYKLGSASTHLSELQIAAYFVMLRKAEISDKLLGFGWLGHRDCSLDGYFEKSAREIYQPDRGHKTSASELAELAEKTMSDMAASVRQGIYKPVYDPKNKGCSSCPFSVLCRKRESSGYDEAEEMGEENE